MVAVYSITQLLGYYDVQGEDYRIRIKINDIEKVKAHSWSVVCTRIISLHYVL